MAEEKEETTEQPKDDGIRIDGNVATWELKSEGPILGTYAGTFKFRCYLTPLQLIRAGREYRELLGANMSLAPEHESMLAWTICQLKQRIISAPPFWQSLQFDGLSGDVPDEEILTAILEASINAENKYKDILKKRRAGAIDLAKKAGEAIMQKKRDEEKAPKEEKEEE